MEVLGTVNGEDTDTERRALEALNLHKGFRANAGAAAIRKLSLIGLAKVLAPNQVDPPLSNET